MLRKLGFILACALFASPAAAQSLEEEQAAMEGDEGSSGGGLDSPGDAEEPPPEGGSPSRLDDEQAELEHGTPEDEPVVDTTSPVELEDTDYFFLGAFGRGVIIPGFIQGLFVEGGIDAFNPGVGLTFNWRRNQFNVIANVWWNNAVGDGYFRANGDPPEEQEYIDVDLGVIFINAEFMWSFPLTDWFAFELGFDLGFGFIYGDLVRNEAYESSRGAEDWQPCDGPGDPAGGAYCPPRAPDPCYDNNGGHYDCREPNWFTDGGDTPFIFPWVTLPHLAIRIKPVHQFQIRIDGGYGLYNFFFGGSLSYGF